MASIGERIDRSTRLSDLIKRLSTGLSRRRGLPLMVAVGLAVLSLILHIMAALIPNSPILALSATVVLHIAIITGFVGILFAEPLGKG